MTMIFVFGIHESGASLMNDLTTLSIKELLALQQRTLQALRERGVIRSFNKPVGDFAEYLFCKAFDWRPCDNSQAGYDATDSDGIRYQIKARQLFNNTPGERQLSALRKLEQAQFQFIAGVLLNPDYSIYRGALIPYHTVHNGKTYYAKHDNKHIFYLNDNVWKLPGVVDVTERLRQTFASI